MDAQAKSRKPKSLNAHISSHTLKAANISEPRCNQRTNGPVNTHLISGSTVSTKTNKIGQGQPRVIIYINTVELETPMLHAKFTSDSEEEDF